MDVYDKLIDRLDAIPNGYPRTNSGIEYRILQKLFTPEQAKVALVMHLRCESPARIARRLGKSTEETITLLKSMVADGLIRVEQGKKGSVYGLVPFVVGIYELNLHRLDKELAEMIEAYMVETGPTNPIYGRPSVHRVLPVEQVISSDIKIHPYEQASAILDNAQSWGVRDCICRIQKELVGDGCHHPVEVCITFSAHKHAFDNAPATRPISRDEAFKLLDHARDAGLVHTTGNYRDGHHYICNCCTCSCGILRGVSEFKVPTAIAHSDFRAVVDDEQCLGCGDCMTACQFDAISISDFAASIDLIRCVGCGQCVTICTSDALALERRPREDWEPHPANMVMWMLQRGIKRGFSMFDVI